MSIASETLAALREAGGPTLAESFREATSLHIPGPAALLVVKLSSTQLAFLESRRSEINALLSLETGRDVDTSLPTLIHALIASYAAEARWPT